MQCLSTVETPNNKAFYCDAIQSTGIDRLDLPFYDTGALMQELEAQNPYATTTAVSYSGEAEVPAGTPTPFWSQYEAAHQPQPETSEQNAVPIQQEAAPVAEEKEKVPVLTSPTVTNASPDVTKTVVPPVSAVSALKPIDSAPPVEPMPSQPEETPVATATETPVPEETAGGDVQESTTVEEPAPSEMDISAEKSSI